MRQKQQWQRAEQQQTRFTMEYYLQSSRSESTSRKMRKIDDAEGKSEKQWISVDEKLPEDIDRRYFMCLVENHLEDPPMFCQYEEEYGFGFWKDIYDPVTLGFVDSEFDTMEELGYEKVLYWMPMIEPPEEAMQDD